jgi:hypothetical protein
MRTLQSSNKKKKKKREVRRLSFILLNGSWRIKLQRGEDKLNFWRTIPRKQENRSKEKQAKKGRKSERKNKKIKT